MTSPRDPYRTLGVARGASLVEIRGAYRRLAKQYHPDAAGERALTRFLAIQAAYEQLVDGEGRLRSRRTEDNWSTGGAEPWRADPDRARASREAWRARRAAGGGTGPGAGEGTKAGAGANADGGTKAGAGTKADGGTKAGERRDRAGHGPRRARPGSTTYDEAADTPLDPPWEGGAWYGPSSGTYWTLNPREYADPRKHGPEYQARARRESAAPADPPAGPSTAAAPTPSTATRGPAAPPSPDQPPAPAAPPPPTVVPSRPGIAAHQRRALPEWLLRLLGGREPADPSP